MPTHPVPGSSIASKSIKEECNQLYKLKFQPAITKYDKAILYLCVFVPSIEEEANIMEELGLPLNLNFAACCLKLCAFKAAKSQCDFTLRVCLVGVKIIFLKNDFIILWCLVKQGA